MEEPQFQRVHRMGEGNLQGRHRPIKAKLVLHEEKEKSEKLLRPALSKSHFGNNEQFPKEINDPRKLSIPHFKRTKHLRKKDMMVADKLFCKRTRISPIINP